MKRIIALLLVATPSAANAFDWRHRDHDVPRTIGKRDPSNPNERVPKTTYQSVTAAKSYRPVAPLPWDELNRRVTPRPKQQAPAIK